MKVFVVKDDYDETTVCAVQCDTPEEATDRARKELPDRIDGTPYAYEVLFLQQEAQNATTRPRGASQTEATK